MEVTRCFHQDLTQKVNGIISQGVPAKAQVRQVTVAHKGKGKKATAQDIQVALS